MASQKISQLTAITTVASGDYFPIVRASGTTNQRVEVGVLDERYTLAASGVAAQDTANTALASGNAAGTLANWAFASGVAAQGTADTALASGNAALISADTALASGNAALSSLTNKSLFTAKGTILSATSAATPSGLLVGSDGTFLQADSTAPGGVSWAAGGGAWELISTVNATGVASVQFTNLSSSYSEYIISIRDFYNDPSSNSSYFGCQFSNNNGSTYIANNYSQIGGAQLGSSSTETAVNFSAAAEIKLNNQANSFPSSGYPLNMTLRITGAGSTSGGAIVSFYGFRVYNGAPSDASYFGHGHNIGVTNVNAIKLFDYFSVGNIHGTLRLYGLKTS